MADIRSTASQAIGSVFSDFPASLDTSLSPSLHRARPSVPVPSMHVMRCYIRPKTHRDGGPRAEEIVELPYQPSGDLVLWMEATTAALRSPIRGSNTFPNRAPLGPACFIVGVYSLQLNSYPAIATRMGSLEDILEGTAANPGGFFYLLTLDAHASHLGEVTFCPHPPPA